MDLTLPEDLLATIEEEKFSISSNLLSILEAPGPEAVQTLKGIKHKHHQQCPDQPTTFQIKTDFYKRLLAIHKPLCPNKFASHC